MNRRALESLVKCGSLDGLDCNRNEMINAIAPVLEALDADKRKNVDGQLGFFDDLSSEPGAAESFSVERLPDLSAQKKLEMEKEVTGMYLSGHPMKEYLPYYEKSNISKTGDIIEDTREQGGRFHDGDKVMLLGILTAVRMKVTKNNSTMAFITLEDMFGSIEILVFPNTLAQYADMVAEGKIVKLLGRISMTEDKDTKLVCEQVLAPEAEPALKGGVQPARKKNSRNGLYLKVASKDDAKYKKALQYTAVFDGFTPLYVRFEDTNKMVRAPERLWVSVNDVLENALKRLLGDGNVAVIR